MAPSRVALAQAAASPSIARRGRPGQAAQRDLGAGIAELALGAQHEHRQALQRRREHAGAAGQQELVVGRAARPRSSPAAGPWPSRSRPAAPARAERENVVGELALQEGGGIGAARRGSRPSRSSRQAPLDRERGDGHAPLSSAAHDMRGAGAGALARSSRDDESLALPVRCCCSSPRRRRLLRPGGGCTGRCRWPPIRSSCRSSPARRRARSPRPGSRPACRPSPLLLYEWFRWSGRGAQDPRRQLRDRRRHDADRPARQDGARRRDARPPCASSKAGPSASSAPSWRKRRGLKPTTAGDERRRGDGRARRRPACSPEGRFFPDTYAYSKGVERPRGAASAPTARCSGGWTRRGPSAPPTRR